MRRIHVDDSSETHWINSVPGIDLIYGDLLADKKNEGHEAPKQRKNDLILVLRVRQRKAEPTNLWQTGNT